jgi:hypothetical protein
MGWDIGATGTGGDLALVQRSARVCAWWTLAAGVVIIAFRFWWFEHRWFVLTGAALLQIALHGLMGVSYLLAGAISAGLAIIVIAASYFMRSRPDE